MSCTQLHELDWGGEIKQNRELACFSEFQAFFGFFLFFKGCIESRLNKRSGSTQAVKKFSGGLGVLGYFWVEMAKNYQKGAKKC